MKVIIVSGGNCPSFSLLQSEFKKCDMLICADSGGDCLYSYRFMPDYLIGDMDSINEKALNFFLQSNTCRVEKYPKDKDFTDTQLALNKAISIGAHEIVLLGCTGSRLDHVLGNLGLLKTCLNHNIKAVIKDDNNEIFLTDKSIKLEGSCGKYFSVQAFETVIRNLSITGGKFDLSGYDLAPGDPLTISNEFTEETVHISFKNGLLLIMYCKD